jgi:hypothetical protein
VGDVTIHNPPVIGTVAVPGPRGPAGERGEDGLSAYQLWLAEGNVGTIEEFLESLIGPPGKDGEDGEGGPGGGGDGVVTGSVSMHVAVPDGAPSTLYLTTTPSSVYDPVTDRTVFVYLGGLRDLFAIEYDHATSAWRDPVFVGTYALTDLSDSHGAPSICIDGAGVYRVVYGTHNGFPKLAVASAPHSIAGWTVTVAPNLLRGTYHQIAYDATSNAVYILFRTGGAHSTTYPGHEFASLAKLPLSGPGAGTWVDLGATATTGGGILDLNLYNGANGKDAYVTSLVARAGRLYIAWSNVFTGHDGTRADACVAYYDTADGLMKTMAGATIGAKIGSQQSDFALCQVVAQDEVYPVKLALDPDGQDAMLAFNRYDTAAQLFRVQAAKWNGSTWTVVNVGVTHNHLFNGVTVRKRASDGKWEVCCIRKATGARGEQIQLSTGTQGPALTIRAGGDLVIAVSDTGATWAIDTIIPASRFQGGGCRYLHTPVDARENLIAFAMPITLDEANWDTPIYALGRKDIDLMRQAPAFAARAPFVHHVNSDDRIIVADGTAIPASFTAGVISLATRVPFGTKAVLLAVRVTGTGTSGAGVIAFRDPTATERAGGDAEITHRGEFTDTTVVDVWVPVSPDRRIAWKTTATNIRAGLRLRALKVG